jgi:hypothetical protein
MNAIDHRVKRFCKHVLSFEALLLLILVIFKLKCNNLIFNEIMVLNASYVCLHAFSLHRESPIWILEDGPLNSEVVLSQPLPLFFEITGVAEVVVKLVL